MTGRFNPSLIRSLPFVAKLRLATLLVPSVIVEQQNEQYPSCAGWGLRGKLILRNLNDSSTRLDVPAFVEEIGVDDFAGVAGVRRGSQINDGPVG